MQSTIPGAGLGLFIERFVSAGTIIGQYTGVTRQAAGHTRTAYDLQVSGGRIVDASDPENSSLFRYANHKPRKTANVRFSNATDGTFENACRTIITTKDINGSRTNPKEIFINYGPSGAAFARKRASEA
jgi:hypothetical protein